MNQVDICPVCGVRIEGETVHFSHGKPGTRERLQARVCQFAKKLGCINVSKEPASNDYYGLPNDRLIRGLKSEEIKN